jgi:hypothetical protein
MRFRLASLVFTTALLATLNACGFQSLQQQPPPSPSTSPSATASPTKHAGIQIPTNWVSFSWKEAGFSVKLPNAPKKATAVRYVRRVPFVLRFAVISNSPGPIEVGVTQIGARLTPKAVGDVLQGSVKSFAAATGSTVTSQKALKYRGYRALKAILSRGTQNFQLLVFQRDPAHEVFILAPEGEVFDAVASTLKLH